MRPLATALAVQSNYLGWSFGSLIPNLVPNGLAMRTFGFWQAVVVSGCLPLFVLAKEELSPLPTSSRTSSRRRLVDGADDAIRVPLAGASSASDTVKVFGQEAGVLHRGDLRGLLLVGHRRRDLRGRLCVLHRLNLRRRWERRAGCELCTLSEWTVREVCEVD